MDRTVKIKISKLSDYKTIADIARGFNCYVDAGTHNWRISAKSEMGLMALDCTIPVTLIFPEERYEEIICAFANFIITNQEG